ncbi:MAG: AmmeMemoRadiSam system protein A, partial [Bacteroidales bacterium]|nr:AmmeMemoRadiSam system protein A [Bacteroidales bacterium]
KVNIPLADKLISENGLFDYHPSAHSGEHSLEVQLPFLQYKLKNDFQIVPIVIGTHDKEECKKMAETLKPYFNKNNLFVISSDFSHYPHYEAAKEVDQITANAITSNSPQSLVETLASNSQKGIANLATSLCGWSSVLTLMNMTSGMDSINYHQVLYKNSGDAGITDRSQVVGYYAIAVSLGEEEESSGFHLSEQDKTQLLTIARKTISSYITLGKIPEFKPDQFSPKLLTKCGAFVTLHKGGELRGCIGQFTPSKPLYMVIRENAISASTKDTRFFPVQPDEVDELEIEVSVLTPLKKIESIDEFKLGKHGIYIKNGKRSGTLLPQVAQSTGWSLEEFLGHCAKDKAGLAWDGWKDSDLYTYEAIIFKESDFTE